MIAILSDIHGNLEALEAVFADIARHEVNAIYCLGDLVGYGPDPLPCIERAMDWQLVLQGYFDRSALSSDDLPGLAAARHARETLLRFRDDLSVHPRQAAIRKFMAERPNRYADADAHFVHGTLRDPLNEYLFPESIFEQEKLRAIGGLFDRLCFCGHTHIAGIFTGDQGQDWKYLPQDEIDVEYFIPDSQTICNVGSVGQPRDSNIDACYVLWGNQRINFRRVPYDIERTIAKIKADSDNNMDGDRYRFGR